MRPAPAYIWIVPAKYFFAFLLSVAIIFTLTLGLPDVVFALAGTYASAESIQGLRAQLNLVGSPIHQFIGYWDAFLSGSMRSFYTREALIEVLPRKLAVSTLLLGASIAAMIIMTGLWLAIFRLFRRAPVLRLLLISSAASIPLFVSAILLLYASTALGFSPWIGGAVALALFPSVLLSTNIRQHWITLRRKSFMILAVHYRVGPVAMLRRRLLEFLPSLTIAINATAFFVATGIAVTEWMFGIPGFGRWTLESILRLDIPIVFLAGVVASAFVSLLLMCEEMLRWWFGIDNGE